MTSILKVTEIQDPTNSNSAATIGSDGLFKARTCAFRMYPNAAQSLAHGTVTVLTFTNTSFDSDNLVDLSNNKVVITAATAGLWYLDVTFRMSNTVAYRQTTQILVNGSAIVQGEQGFYSQTTGAYPSCNAHTLHELSSGDEITFTGYQAYGSARNTYVNGGLSTFAQGYRIGMI